ncbi:MAG: hypothetical protein MK132_01730 [Lentisphaerales bacterium]|nr:hypothetical protein [Lentisphaerales bacterium]
MLIILFLSACMSISPEQQKRIIYTHEQLSVGGLDLADDITFVCMRNEFYSGRLNNLVSWKNSQELMKSVAEDYLKIDKFVTIEAVDQVKLQDFFTNLRGKRLILYFSSHLLSNGHIIFGNEEKLGLKVFADYVNSLQVPTLLIFDTCYSAKLKPFLSNKNVSVFYTGKSDELVYDMRIKGQKLSVDEKFNFLRKYLHVIYDWQERNFSLFSVLFVDSLISGRKPNNLGQLFEQMIKGNEEVRKVFGMGKYSQMQFVDSDANWGELEFK